MRPILPMLVLLLTLASPLRAQTPAPIATPTPDTTADKAPEGATVPEYTRSEVIYERKFGTALTMDVIQPKNPNGYAVIYIVSSGWTSSHANIKPEKHADLLSRGYTIFHVCHGSQPKYTIPEMVADLHRAVRYIRRKASVWGINPDKLGLSGGSAGGHLALCIATMGGVGAPGTDAIDNTSSAVQAVAVFYPPTDFANYGKPGVSGAGVGQLRAHSPSFGPESFTPDGRARLSRDFSPINFISAATPPVLIVHGEKDDTVPLQQAETFIEKAKAAGIPAELVVKPGAGHGWKDIAPDYARMADFFDLHLRGIKK